MELLIVHAPYCMSLQPAIVLENAAYSSNSVIDQLKEDLTTQDIEIFNIVHNVIFADDGCHIVTEPDQIMANLLPDDHPYMFIELYLKYPHLIPQ